MNLSQFQDHARSTAHYPDEYKVVYPVLALCGEAGESANIVKKAIRAGKPLTPEQKSDLIDELGDCLWYIAAAASDLEIDLAEVAWRNQHKLAVRYQLD